MTNTLSTNNTPIPERKKERNKKFDTLKEILIILVILGHIPYLGSDNVVL